MGIESEREEGFNAVYREYRKLVYRIAYHYTYNIYDAEDITQDVFFRYYIFAQTSDVNYIRNWMITTAKNVALNHMKHASYERLLWSGEEIQNMIEEEWNPEDDLFGYLRKNARSDCACRILCDLKAKKKKWYIIAVYAYCNQMPRQQIADRMNMSLDAVAGTLKRIKAWIIKHYKDEFDHINIQ